MAKRRSRKGTAKIQYVPTDRFVKVVLDNLSIGSNKVFVAWRSDIHNGLPQDAYVLVPHALSKHIILSLKDNGCGWIEARQPNERTVEFKMRFNISPYYPDEKESKGVRVKFELFEPENQEPVSDTELDVSLQCNKSMNKVLKGSLESYSSLSASAASGIKDEAFNSEPTRLHGSCDGTLINISLPMDFKMERLEGLKRKLDDQDEQIPQKRQHVDEPDQLFLHPEPDTTKNPLRLSVSLDISGWLRDPIPDLSLQDSQGKIASTIMDNSLPYPCLQGY